MAARAGGTFPKTKRLLRRSEFDRVQNGPGAKRASSAHFLVLASKRPASGPRTAGPRVGIIASRRVGSAVRRNRAKRMIRHWFRTHSAAIGDVDVVVVVKIGAHELSQAQSDTELDSASARALKALT